VAADPQWPGSWGDRAWRRRRLSVDAALRAMFPESLLEGTPWLQLWREHEARVIVVASRIGLVLTAIAFVAHWFLVDVPLQKQPVERWFTYRFGSALFFLALLASTFLPALARPPLVRIPPIVSAIVLGALEAKTVEWDSRVGFYWAFPMTLAPLLFARLSVPGTLAAFTGCLGVQWLFAWRNTDVATTNLVSATIVSAILGVVMRATQGDAVRAFLTEKRELDAQKKLIETQIEMDRVKTSFFTNVSHELRTPLTLILAPLESMLAAGRSIPREFRADLEAMHRNAERVLRHINALLHLSRLDANREYLKLEEEDAVAMLRALVDSGRPLAEKRHIVLRFEPGEGMPRVPLDREKIEQIALNLLGNALRFTDGTELDPGHVIVRCGLRGAMFFFEIEDDGVGIPADHVGRIFDRFHQVPGHAARGGGTGIGLALVKELTEFHMGGVSVRSRLGHGSTFTVVLPVDASAYPPDRLDRRQGGARPALERRRPILRPRLELVSSTEPMTAPAGAAVTPAPRTTPLPAPRPTPLPRSSAGARDHESAVPARPSADPGTFRRHVLLETIQAFALAVDARTSYAAGHSRRVAILAERVAREMGLPEKDVELARIAGLLHDVGKIGTPESMLAKRGPLSADEWELFKKHPALGQRIVSAVKELEPAGSVILHHHERFDGSGYPAGLAGEAIPLLSRIVAACDAYDDLTTERPHRAAADHRAALAELLGGAGRQLDPAVVRAFARLYEDAAPVYPAFPSGLREVSEVAVPVVEP
jgi:putative nucleotidyltransferase with HDIG domain